MPFILCLFFLIFLVTLLPTTNPYHTLRWVVLCTSTNTYDQAKKNLLGQRLEWGLSCSWGFACFLTSPPIALYGRFWSQACVWWWANLPYLTKLEKKTLNLYHYLSSPTKQTFRGEAISPKGHESKRHQRLRWEGFYGQSFV